MDFIQHAINWCKGEIFEGRIILLFGLGLAVSAFLFWKMGDTPNAKAMIWPVGILGLLLLGSGIGMNLSNQKRIERFKVEYAENPQQFIKDEKERVEDFIAWYPKIRWTAVVVGIIGMLVFVFWATPLGRAIGITLLLFTISVFALDHFSEERGVEYHNHILEHLK